MGGRIKNLRFSPHDTYIKHYTIYQGQFAPGSECSWKCIARQLLLYRGPSRLFADPFRVRLTEYGAGGGVNTGNRMKQNTHTAKRSVSALIKIVLGQGQKCIQSSRYTNIAEGGVGALCTRGNLIDCHLWYFNDYTLLLWLLFFNTTNSRTAETLIYSISMRD